MDKGISVIVILSVKTDEWHCRLFSAIARDTHWACINQIVDVLQEFHDKNEIGKLRYYPVSSNTKTFDTQLSEMWSEGLTAEELEDYLNG